MTKLSNIVSELTAEELEELIKKAQLKLDKLKAGKQVKLIAVSSGILVHKWFALTDKEKAISYAHNCFNKQLEDSIKRGYLNGEISIDTNLIPEPEVDSYLRMNND